MTNNKATVPGGKLVDITDKCHISIPNFGMIHINNLPDISDSKSAAYNDEPIIGRSFPLKTFSHSENRSISMQLHFFITHPNDVFENIAYLRAIQSAVYPRDTGVSGAPYTPPVVCQIKCGKLLGEDPLCVVLKQYSVKFPTDVAWDTEDLVPWKFDVDTTWEVVYQTTDLPGAERILQVGN